MLRLSYPSILVPSLQSSRGSTDVAGGQAIILNYAGKDATPGFEPIHNKDIVNLLPPEAFVGKLDAHSSSLPQVPPKTQPAPPSSVANAATSQPQALVPVLAKSWSKPPLEHMLNIFDFEAVAQNVMKKEGWDYYSSGADEEITLRENHAAFQVPRTIDMVRKLTRRFFSGSGCVLASLSTCLPLIQDARHVFTYNG